MLALTAFQLSAPRVAAWPRPAEVACGRCALRPNAPSMRRARRADAAAAARMAAGAPRREGTDGEGDDSAGGGGEGGGHARDRPPSAQPDSFVRVRVLSVGPPDPVTAASLLTLLPEDPADGDGFRTAFRMSVSAHQARAIRDLLVDKNEADAEEAGQGSSSQARKSSTSSADRQRVGQNENRNYHPQHATPCFRPMRPTTHALFQALLHAQGGQVLEAAVTHIASDVFIASILVRQAPLHGEPGTVSCVALDARPSDAIAIAAQAGAPLYLRRDLLRAWPVSVAAVQLDAAAGLCECMPPFLPLQELSTSHPTFADAPATGASSSPSSADASSRAQPKQHSTADKTSSASRFLDADAAGLAASARPVHAPEYERLVNLYAHLDVAVRCERFRDAAHLRDEITALCPLDRLREALGEAVARERFVDAAHLRDEITRWEHTLEQWESPDTTRSISWSTSTTSLSSFTPWEGDDNDHGVGWDPRIGGMPRFPGRPWVEYDASLDMDYMDTSAHPPDLGDQDMNTGNGDASHDSGPSPADPSP
jgi:bifunctional DNase/RNase